MDSIEKTPLSFVTIKFDGGGLYTNEKGKFNLSEIKGKSIELSILGYRTKHLMLSAIKDTISLSLKATPLDEVIVSDKSKWNKTVIKPPKKARNFGADVLFPKNELLLVLFPDTLYEKSYIEDLTFNFVRKTGSKDYKQALQGIEAVIRVNLYQVDEEMPSDQVYASEPIKISSFLKDETILDLSNEFITIPKHGIFIGLEMIGYYDQVFNEVSDQGYIRPMLTEKDYEGFTAKTYLRYPLNQDKKMILIGDLLKKGGMYKGNFDRNLSIGLTLSKTSD